MTKKSTASSSSAKKAASADFKDVGRLGELIVESLSRPDDQRDEPDLLSRWISHELSAAIAAVEIARSAKARREAIASATDLIVRLWAHRTHWPRGWPPEAAKRRISQLESRITAWAESPESSGSAWFDGAKDLDLVAVQELQLWWQLGLLEQGVEAQRALLDRLPEPADDEPESDDIRLLRREIELHDEAKAWAEAHEAKTTADVRELARARFRALAAQRSKLVRKTLATTPPKTAARRSAKKPAKAKAKSTRAKRRARAKD
jgi:hypothetical protein